MRKLFFWAAAPLLGACTYSSRVNQEKMFGNADITKVDWSKVDGRGSSCQTNWLFGLFPAGDNSIASAVQSADIVKIAYVNTDWTLYLPLLMTRDCVNVWGELSPSARKAATYGDFEPVSVVKPVEKPVEKPSVDAKAIAKPVAAKKEGKASESKASDYVMPAGIKQ